MASYKVESKVYETEYDNERSYEEERDYTARHTVSFENWLLHFCEFDINFERYIEDDVEYAFAFENVIDTLLFAYKKVHKEANVNESAYREKLFYVGFECVRATFNLEQQKYEDVWIYRMPWKELESLMSHSFLSDRLLEEVNKVNDN